MGASTLKHQKGFSLTEVVIVLVIAAILTVYLTRATQTRQVQVASEVQTLYKTMQAARAKAVSGQNDVRIEFDDNQTLRIISVLNSDITSEAVGPTLHLNHIAIQQGDSKTYTSGGKPDTIYWGLNGELPKVAKAKNNNEVAAALLEKHYYGIFDLTNGNEFLTFIRLHGTGIVDMVDYFIATPLTPKATP